jgi:hypothetical protein
LLLLESQTCWGDPVRTHCVRGLIGGSRRDRSSIVGCLTSSVMPCLGPWLYRRGVRRRRAIGVTWDRVRLMIRSRSRNHDRSRSRCQGLKTGCRAGSLIRIVFTIISSVTDPRSWNADSIVALEVSLSAFCHSRAVYEKVQTWVKWYCFESSLWQ